MSSVYKRPEFILSGIDTSKGILDTVFVVGIKLDYDVSQGSVYSVVRIAGADFKIN